MAVVYPLLRNHERAGEAKNCKVELSTVAAPAFHLDHPDEISATDHVLEDTSRIVWQPGELPPGAERELELRSQEFSFERSVAAKVRVV